MMPDKVNGKLAPYKSHNIPVKADPIIIEILITNVSNPIPKLRRNNI